MQNERIVIKLHALNWMMGEFAYFEIELSDAGYLTVDWGNGKTSSYRPRYKGETLRPEHDYGKNAKTGEQHFTVILESHCATIQSFHTGCIDMAIDDIDICDSPSVESLNMCSLGEIDLSPITALKHLVCQGSEATTLDFRSNTNLETLDCRFSKVQRLLLSRCNNLKEIDCSYCHDLREITLGNDSQLQEIVLPDNQSLKSKSLEYVRKTIEKNHGKIKNEG